MYAHDAHQLKASEAVIVSKAALIASKSVYVVRALTLRKHALILDHFLSIGFKFGL